MTLAIETSELTKRYHKVTALADCTVSVPEGRISALIGPNGAGKTTLLRLLGGLARPTAGQVTVNGSAPRQDPAFLAGIGFLAQDVPLYRRLSAEDHIRAGAHLNPRWDAPSVRERLTSLKIPLDRAVGKLSGGQRAQVALALILAKQPRLLLLDEPVAALDPLARRNFLGLLADGVAVGGLTVVLSSHLVADLERVCDHIIMLAASRVQLCGDIEEILAEHQMLIGPGQGTTSIERSHRVVQVTRTPRQTSLLVRRQHRIQFLAGAALLAAFAAVIVVTGVQVADQYHALQAACPAHGCQPGSGLFLGSHAVGFLVICTLGAPALVGLFWGAPLVAAEAEGGTAQFAWMQSITRKRWLAVKIGWMLLAAAVWGGVISVLVTWWEGPNNALQLDAFKPGRFDIMGAVPVAYSLFAVALGIAAGAVTRRVLPAMAVTLAGFVAVRAAVALWLRPHYMSAVTVFFKVTRGFTPPGAYWQIASGVLFRNGQPVPQPNGVNYVDGIPQTLLPASCVQTSRGAFAPPPSCTQALAQFRGFLTYQPAGRYWAFQGIETGIFLALAGALVAVTAAVLLRRDA